jgi:hypothetical protein
MLFPTLFAVATGVRPERLLIRQPPNLEAPVRRICLSVSGFSCASLGFRL